MSFLDCITCAFGSVVLVYTLINAQGGLRAQTAGYEAARRSLQDGREGAGGIPEAGGAAELDDRDREGKQSAPKAWSKRVLEETERLKVERGDADKTTLSRREAIERLKADLKSLEDGDGASKARAKIRALPVHACAVCRSKAIVNI